MSVSLAGVHLLILHQYCGTQQWTGNGSGSFHKEYIHFSTPTEIVE
jgi:hypothetical protein